MTSPKDWISQNPFLLAPMAGISDIAFRGFMKKLGASVVTTELVSANGLKYSSDRTRRLMQVCDSEAPVGIQIFGETLDALDYAAKESEQEGAQFIDLNFGCPVTKVVKKGAGSAVLKDLSFMRDILRTVKSAVSIPVTIKIRTGWTHENKNSHEVCQIAYDEGMSWVAIHGRTRSQAYEGKADWDYIKEVTSEAKLPVIGNGDITTPELAIKRFDESGCDAVMIGRGCLKNPWIFREAMKLHRLDEGDKEEHNFMSLIHDLKNAYDEHFEEKIVLLQLKKFSSWFSSGYSGSANFRKEIFKIKEMPAMLDHIFGYFEPLCKTIQEDTSAERFLMGGHG